MNPVKSNVPPPKGTQKAELRPQKVELRPQNGNSGTQKVKSSAQKVKPPLGCASGGGEASPNLKHLTRKRMVRFWGRRHWVTPALVAKKLGNGKQLIWYEPMDTRPNYYLIFVDSAWNTSNWRRCREHVCDHRDEIRNAIMDEYLKGWETWFSGKTGREYRRHNPFPALSDDCGASWGEIE